MILFVLGVQAACLAAWNATRSRARSGPTHWSLGAPRAVVRGGGAGLPANASGRAAARRRQWCARAGARYPR
jgi:hypothetical protein